MSASQEELEYALRSSVETFVELIVRGMMSKDEILERVEEILTEMGY